MNMNKNFQNKIKKYKTSYILKKLPKLKISTVMNWRTRTSPKDWLAEQIFRTLNNTHEIKDSDEDFRNFIKRYTIKEVEEAITGVPQWTVLNWRTRTNTRKWLINLIIDTMIRQYGYRQQVAE